MLVVQIDTWTVRVSDSGCSAVKYELLVAVFVVYQLSIYLFMRQWVKTRENRVMKLVETWNLRPAEHQHLAVMTHAQWRKQGILVLAMIIIALIFVAVLGSGASIEDFSWSSILIGVLLILALSWTPWALVAEAYGIVMVLDNHTITRMSPWSKELTINWSDVESVTYSAFWAWFTVRTAEGSIHVTTVIGGIERLARAIVAFVPRDRIHVSRDIMNKALRGPFRY